MKPISTINIILIIIIFAVIAIPSIITVKKRHEDALLKVTENKIIETAKKCFLEDKCKNDNILLKELYEYNLLSRVAHPLTKEYYNINSYVIVSEYKFIEVKD